MLLKGCKSQVKSMLFSSKNAFFSCCSTAVIHAYDGRRTRCMVGVVHIERRPSYLVVTAYQHERYAIMFLLFCNYRIQKRQAAFDENFLLAPI